MDILWFIGAFVLGVIAGYSRGILYAQPYQERALAALKHTEFVLNAHREKADRSRVGKDDKYTPV